MLHFCAYTVLLLLFCAVTLLFGCLADQPQVCQIKSLSLSLSFSCDLLFAVCILGQKSVSLLFAYLLNFLTYLLTY